MRCESGMEVSPDVVLCDASVQYMFCGAKDFATLIIDFSSVGATSAPGQTRSFGDVGFDVRFARKRTRLGDSTRPSSPDPSLSELSRSYLGSGALASRIPALAVTEKQSPQPGELGQGAHGHAALANLAGRWGEVAAARGQHCGRARRTQRSHDPRCPPCKNVNRNHGHYRLLQQIGKRKYPQHPASF